LLILSMVKWEESGKMRKKTEQTLQNFAKVFRIINVVRGR
jgi:hypothetical protein